MVQQGVSEIKPKPKQKKKNLKWLEPLCMCVYERAFPSLVHQSYRPSCSQTSTRKSTISLRGMGWGNNLLLPSKLSYDAAFQLILAPWLGSGRLLLRLSFPTQRSRVWFQRRRPWFTNSGGGGGLEFLAPDWESKVWLDEEMLPWEGKVVLSISTVLVDQKSSETFGFFLNVLAVGSKGGGSFRVSVGLGSL